ncbi:hypothetical protein [Duncaniella muris]|uniref:hypothetical protein n=1 Tax=Duncaniella muris TaxID=2094150 RepID=UPI003F6655B8
MKKAISIILFICSMVCLIFAGCSDDGEIYLVKQVVIDVNSECILLDINDKTLSDYQGVANGIDSIGNKIKIKDNKVFFNGKETKNLEAVIAFDDKYNEYYINFSQLPPIVMKGSKVFENEIYIYIPVQQKLSYLIYMKD